MSFQSAKPSNYDWIISIWNYRDPQVERMMRYVKTYPNDRLLRRVVIFIKNHMAGTDSEKFFQEITDDHLFIPVPIHRTRFRERGFNQSELLARAFSAKTPGRLVTSILSKKISTHKQGTLKSKKDRVNNLIGSFEIKNKHLILEKDIIIIDDITTTGSTLVEARTALLNAGARTVVAMTLAN